MLKGKMRYVAETESGCHVAWLTEIRCPSCGYGLAYVHGLYSLRCKRCKAHPIVYGNTETGEQYIKTE